MEYKIQYGGLEAKENCKTRVGFILKRQLIGFIVKMKLKGVILTPSGWRKQMRMNKTQQPRSSNVAQIECRATTTRTGAAPTPRRTTACGSPTARTMAGKRS